YIAANRETTVAGWHFSPAYARDKLVDMICGSQPRIFGISINGNALKDYSVYPKDYDTYTGMFMIDKDSKEIEIGKIGMNNFIKNFRGMVSDYLPEMTRARYMLNYGEVVDLNLNPDGSFIIKNPTLLEGQNNIIMEAYNGAGKRSRQILLIYLDMMPMQVFPITPGYEANIRDTRPVIKAGIYNSDIIGEFDPDRVKVYLKQVGNWTNGDAGDWINVSPACSISGSEISYIPVTDLAEGLHAVKVESADASGNKSTTVWGFYVDLTPPVISFSTNNKWLFSCAAGNRILIEYYTEDNIASMLKNMEFKIYRKSDNSLVADLGKSGSLSTGPAYKYWEANGMEDGEYYIRISGSDMAGNSGYGIQYFSIDSTPPVLDVLKREGSAAHLSDLILAEDLYYQVEFDVNEEAGVVFTFTNQQDKSYYQIACSSTNGINTYSWDLSNPFLELKDGLYKLGVRARDAAGNLGNRAEFENIRVDRSAPVIYNLFTRPFVMSGNGQKITTLYYSLSESEDEPVNQSDQLIVNVEVYGDSQAQFTNDRENIVLTNGKVLVAEFGDEPDSMSEANTIQWDGKFNVSRNPVLNGKDAPSGKYKFRISVRDKWGNEAVRYSDAIKNGIAPEIASIADKKYILDAGNKSIPGSVQAWVDIRGTAVDVNWANRADFKNYRLYYRSGMQALPEDLKQLDTGWKYDGLCVPQINQESSDPVVNVSIRPVQSESVLGWWDTTKVENGIYTLLLIAEEQDVPVEVVSGTEIGTLPGGIMGDLVVVTVSNDAGAPVSRVNITNFAVMEHDVPVSGTVVFMGTNRIAINYSLDLSEIPSADVNIEIYGPDNNNVFRESEEKVTGGNFGGTPVYTAGADPGYYIWQDYDGWHIRMSGDGTRHEFNGDLTTDGAFQSVSEDFDAEEAEGINYRDYNKLSFNCTGTGDEDGIDFKTTGSYVSFHLYIDKSDAVTEKIFYDSGNISPA
ncbi:MAG: hypothetical protein PHF84_12860, partial [bacterium]|nr:hypothetical protein [bacterium]